jgi:hypothetical protein
MESGETEGFEIVVAQRLLDRRVSGHAPEPVGEPAATAALNFDTPRRRSSLKRLCPFCHCRQRYERLRRIHASRFVSTRGVWQKPK